MSVDAADSTAEGDSLGAAPSAACVLPSPPGRTRLTIRSSLDVRISYVLPTYATRTWAAGVRVSRDLELLYPDSGLPKPPL
jgi:hypothetical protein